MKIAVTRRIPESGVEVLVKAFGREQVHLYDQDSAMTRETLLDFVSGACAVLSTITENMDTEAMDVAGPELKVIANMAVGYDNIDLAAAVARGIYVTNTPGVLTDATADLAWSGTMFARWSLGRLGTVAVSRQVCLWTNPGHFRHGPHRSGRGAPRPRLRYEHPLP